MKLKIDLFMWLKSIKANKWYYIYLLIVACIFYAMNCYTPLYSDDWHYNFIYGTNKDINSFYDILYSQYIHYFQVNGRFIPHVFVQLFDGILGKQMFNVINTFVFVAYLCLLSYTIQPNNELINNSNPIPEETAIHVPEVKEIVINRPEATGKKRPVYIDKSKREEFIF